MVSFGSPDVFWLPCSWEHRLRQRAPGAKAPPCKDVVSSFTHWQYLCNEVGDPTAPPVKFFGGQGVLALYNYPKGGCSKMGAEFFSKITSDRMRGDGLKLHHGRLGLDIMDIFFQWRGGQAWKQAAQGNSGIPILGSVQKVCGWGTQRFGLVVSTVVLG